MLAHKVYCVLFTFAFYHSRCHKLSKQNTILNFDSQEEMQDGNKHYTYKIVSLKQEDN